jgi:hypothetical protein
LVGWLIAAVLIRRRSWAKHAASCGRGVLAICVPFLYRIHADPYDYGRHTEFYWTQALTTAELRGIRIERHGCFWSLLVDVLRESACQVVQGEMARPHSRTTRRPLSQAVALGALTALRWDGQLTPGQHPFLTSYSTKFGIRVVKSS